MPSKGFFEGTVQSKSRSINRLSRCGACGLSRQCTSPRMPPTGSGDRKVLFVAEAPGKFEDQRGVQLIGDAGQLLRGIVWDVDGSPDLDDAWKTNAVICRPPKNKIEDRYIEACRPNLLRTIKELSPKVVVLMGLSPVKSLIGSEFQGQIGSISKWEGWAIPSHQLGAWILPTYHPSYLLRMNEDPVLMRCVKTAVSRAFLYEETNTPFPCPPLSDLQNQVQILTKPRDVRLWMRGLLKRKGKLVFDYETNGLKPEGEGHYIKAVSFCYEGEETVSCLLHDTCLPLLSKILRNPSLQKIAANLKFEERWTRAMLGHRVVNWFWDTMLVAHMLDNRKNISGLKFQAYARFGITDYASHVSSLLKAPAGGHFNRIEQIPVKELLLYNGLDSLLTYMLMKAQHLELKGRS